MGFITSSGIFSKFVLKSWEVIQYGMSKNDEKTLTTFGNQLSTNFINELEIFVESARSELVGIQSQLLLEATGGKVQNLLDKRKELESEFLQLSTLLKDKASERDVNQGIIDLLQLGALLTKISSTISSNSQGLIDLFRSAKNASFRCTADLSTVNDEIKLRAVKLQGQLLDCKNKINENRDHLSKKQKSLFKWAGNLRHVHVGDVAASAQNNLKKFMERTDSPDCTNEASGCDTNSAIFEQGKELFTEYTGHWDEAKGKIMAIIGNLKGQIYEYQGKMQEFRDRRLEKQGSFWIFSWKIRDIYYGNSEKIVQENIDRLLGRTKFLGNLFQNGSIVDLLNGLSAGKAGLPFYEEKQIILEEEHKKLQESHDKVSKEFYAVIEELYEIYRSTGTVNVESMKMVDQLCCAVQTGQDSITSAYAMMRIHLSAINVDSDLLVSSVLDALQVLNMIDAYIDTTKIEDVKRVMALE
ncbi:unnamed protein product [Rotaria sp. Silwood1]|nr:unnamed protein product [Rotaria sp. Silwood1]CAF4914718.1 unnamed protein product [Rotaria sp. Silwood1]